MKRKPILSYLKSYLFYISTILILSSCGSKQDIVYFQGTDAVGSSTSVYNYNSVIRPDDRLTINVSALDQDAVVPFNLPAVSFNQANGNIGASRQQTYLVDSNGTINFPVLGTLKLVGLNKIQATTMIRDMLKEYIKDPIVNIRTVNFKVTVLGEVKKPGSYTIQNDRITILEALGLAGDLNIQGQRDNVFVLREADGKKTYNRIDLTSEELFNSPMYYLTQNDVIYVQPNNSRIRSSTVGPNTNATLGLVSTLATVAALLISITSK